VPPKLFKGIAAAMLVAIGVLAVSAWGRGNDSGSQIATTTAPRLDLATANRALAVAAPGAGVRISNGELSADDYPPDSTPVGSYAPAPSTAQGMTHEWHKYAAMVDRVCALSWNYMRLTQARAAQVAYENHWTERRSAAALWRLTADEDARILQATAILGQPPQEQALFASWRANVATRTKLFRRASRAAAAADFALAQRICARIARLKTAADRLGQRFGLRICTSN
jgi:hypothetical protein